MRIIRIVPRGVRWGWLVGGGGGWGYAYEEGEGEVEAECQQSEEDRELHVGVWSRQLFATTAQRYMLVDVRDRVVVVCACC